MYSKTTLKLNTNEAIDLIQSYEQANLMQGYCIKLNPRNEEVEIFNAKYTRHSDLTGRKLFFLKNEKDAQECFEILSGEKDILDREFLTEEQFKEIEAYKE